MYHHLNSPSLPSLLQAHVKELEEPNEMLGKDQAAKRRVEEKAALKAELETSSQALLKEVYMSFLLLDPSPAFTFLPAWALCLCFHLQANKY